MHELKEKLKQKSMKQIHFEQFYKEQRLKHKRYKKLKIIINMNNIKFNNNILFCNKFSQNIVVNNAYIFNNEISWRTKY